MEIHFIYADGCESCAKMKNILNKLNDEYKFKIISFESEQEEALEYAVKNGINDLPACKIGDIVVQGEHFDEQQIKFAVQKYCR